MAMSCPDADGIPATPGTYALLLFCSRSKQLRLGALGAHPVSRGWYAYVGSAFGPGGLRARCRRHLRPLRRHRWHIDYLRSAAALQGIWFTTDSIPREHRWVEIIGGLAGASSPIRRFGSSDCTCPSHLFHFLSRPPFPIFRRQTLRRMPEHGPIMAFAAEASRQVRRNAL
jgi:Uri superfamily endonuclease